MDYQELGKIWNSVLIKLGYRESNPNFWVAETRELIIILSLKVNSREKDFYMDIGIFFKRLHTYNSVYELKFEDQDIGQGLWTFLVYTGEWEYHLNNMFLYDPAINSTDEVKNNINELGMQFLVKVNPHIEYLEYCARQAKDFEKKTTWYRFLEYFRANENHNENFSGNLHLFHVQQNQYRKKKDRF